MKFAHLSDMHFGEDPPELASALARDIAATAPDAVLVSGDLTGRARPGEFAAAADFLDKLGLPVLTVPGNHDIPRDDLWQRFLDPRRGWARFQGAEARDTLTLGNVTVLGLDTVQRAHWHLDWSAGGVSQRRLGVLAERLAAARGQRILLLCHHPLRHPAWATGRRAPAGATAALALLRDAGVEAILSGHLHRAETIPGTPTQIIAPTALSPRIKGSPNGWNLLRLEAAELVVETRWL